MTMSRMCFHMAWNSNIYPCRQLTSSFEYAIPSQYEKSQNIHRASQTRKSDVWFLAFLECQDLLDVD